MIDRLHQTASPLPPRPAAQESPPGVPSFLEWALSNPDAESGSLPDGRSAPDGQHGDPGQAALATPLPPGMLEASLLPAAVDPALSLLPRNLPGDATHANPPMPAPGEPVPPTSALPGPFALAPGEPASHDLAAGMPTPPGLVSGDPAVAVAAATDPQDAVTRMLQCHVRGPNGEREVVSLPWRLAAGGRLDQSLRAPGMVAPGAVSNLAPGAMPPPGNVGSPYFDAQGRLQNGILPPGVLAAGEGVLPPGVVRITARGAEASGAATIGAASTPVVSEWLSRWMKWIERDGHDPVVLLRDYRMDGDETRRVVDSLRAFAREHGVSLERVVVNGHEFWRNPDRDPNANRTGE
ncbi:hypothetical protein [Lysobacter hankyongensis]|uniref:Uncharacterized protein n=1 Tax=Lysobacter hankyongensis TaxID=1176535 RepID=A0ABP9CBL3_9GAMM